MKNVAIWMEFIARRIFYDSVPKNSVVGAFSAEVLAQRLPRRFSHTVGGCL